ncbi:MAG TPA: hypothetical protein VIP05_22360 [Burkholderiaceae bacterium]
MNDPRLPDEDAFDDLLRRSAPEPLRDAGFTARTMAAVERAARARSPQRRPTPPAPLAIARALAAEQQRHDAQARLWRWAIAGIVAGWLLMVLAVLVSPDGGVAIDLSTPGQLFPLCVTLAAGALWLAVREWRSA